MDTIKKTKIESDKMYYVSKIKSDSNYVNEIDCCFNDPKQYLTNNPKIIIGKTNCAPRFDKEDKIIPYSYIGSKAIFKKLFRKTSSRTYNNLKNLQLEEVHHKSDKNSLNSVKNLKKMNYRIIDDKEIEDIYSERITTLKKSFSTIKNAQTSLPRNECKEISNNLPKSISKKLISQEKSLINSEKKIQRDNLLSRNIGMKINRSQGDLLMSRTNELFRTKIESSQSNKYPKGYNIINWIADLRNFKNSKKSRFIYINTGNNLNPKWVVLKETKENPVEYIRKPINFYETIEASNSLFCKFKGFKDDPLRSLQVQGTNLLDEEYTQLKCLKGKKVIYLDDNESKSKVEKKHYPKLK